MSYGLPVMLMTLVISTVYNSFSLHPLTAQYPAELPFPKRLTGSSTPNITVEVGLKVGLQLENLNCHEFPKILWLKALSALVE